MSFPTALPTNEVDYLSTMQFATDCYLLVWRQNIVFKARVNQSEFANTWTNLVYDNIADGYSFTDVLEGHTVWISSTDDIRAAKWWGRMRVAGLNNLLTLEWNSFQPNDNDYIFVTKDVRESIKTPRLSGSIWYADYAISYHEPPPIIYDVPTYIFEQVDDNGNADVTITPGAYAVASGASISSWALDTDGGTQISFNASTGAAVIRYGAPGDYMPRLTVTDSNANTQWFAPFVTIADANLSSAVQLDFNALSIAASVANGWNMTMPFWDGVQDVLDGSMCAVYMPHKTGGNKILFCGRIRTESNDFAVAGRGNVSFQVNGLASIMNNLNVISWRHKDISSPSDFAEIKDLTLWRSIGAYMAIMTNINNTHSLQFDDTSNDYRYLSYFYQKGALLDSLREQMWSVNYDFDFTSDGMFRLNRNMRFQTIAERDALTNVANFEFKHYVGDDTDSIMYSLERDHSSQIGRAIDGCGWYETSTNSVNFFAAISPPVQPGRGTEQTATDRQILKSNLTREDAETEGKRRVQNDFAAKQFLDTLNGTRLGGAFVGKINPSVSDYYTHTITVTDGKRLLAYDTGDKWLMPDLSLGWDNVTGQVVVNPTWQIESEDLGFAISIRNPAPVTPYVSPVQMPLSAFPTFTPNPSINSPTGAQDGDEQPVDKDDVKDVEAAQDPSTMFILDGNIVVIWNGTNVSYTKAFANLTGTTWIDSTPAGGVSGTLQQFVWDRFATSQKAGYCVSNNGTIASPDTRVYRNDDMGTNALWLETILDNILGSQVRTLNKTKVAVYGKFKTFAPAGGFPLQGLVYHSGTNDMSGDGVPDLLPSDHASLSQPATEFPGVYNSSTQKFDGGTDPVDGGVGTTIEWEIPPGVEVTNLSMRYDYNRPTTTIEGHRRTSLEGDTLQFGSAFPTFGEFANVGLGASSNVPIAPGTQEKLYFHAAVDRKASDGAYSRITGVEISGSVETDWVGLRVSEDNGDTFENTKSAGRMTLNGGSMGRDNLKSPLVAYDENVVYWPTVDLSVKFQAPQDDTTSQFAKALWRFGQSDVDYLLAPDGGSVGLYKIINDVRTDITPNDGANDGFAIGIGSLAMSPSDTNKAWFLADFSGTRKVAYTINLQGTTTWNFATGFSSSANWISVNPRNADIVYVADSSTIWQSLDGGATFTAYNSPIGTLTGVEPL